MNLHELHSVSEKKTKLSRASRCSQFGHAKYKEFPEGKADIWSWNINGLNSNQEKGTLKKFFKEADPMVVCLQETKSDMDKITKKKFYQMVPDGYEQYWNCSEDKKGYSGVAILTKVKPI